ncbi:pentapeptide repeat-containing protein [Thiolapillus sp.]
MNNARLGEARFDNAIFHNTDFTGTVDLPTEVKKQLNDQSLAD